MSHLSFKLSPWRWMVVIFYSWSMRAPFKVTFHLLGSVSLMNWMEEKSDFLPKCVYFVKLAITSSLLWHSIFRVPCGSLTDPFVSVLCKYFCTLTYPIFFSHFINLWFCKELELMLNDCHFAEAKINPVLWRKLILPPDRADMLLMGSARALSLTMLSALWHMTE